MLVFLVTVQLNAGHNMLVVALLAAAVATNPVDQRTLRVVQSHAHLKPALLVKVVSKCLLSIVCSLARLFLSSSARVRGWWRSQFQCWSSEGAHEPHTPTRTHLIQHASARTRGRTRLVSHRCPLRV